MTIQLEIKSMISPDLEYAELPVDAEDCAVFIEVEIGEKGKEGAEIFSFTAITPKFLALLTFRWVGTAGLLWICGQSAAPIPA